MALAAPVLRPHDESPARRSLSLASIPVYWHLLSLDAPTVAVLWAWSFSRAAHLPQAPGQIAVLGLGTWLVYVVDRLLDARPSARRDRLRERHFFHSRHRSPLLSASACAIPVLLWLILARMSATARREDAILFAASMLYFSLVHIPALRLSPFLERTFSRECTVGVVFALATAVPAWSQSAAAHRGLMLPVALFAALCSLNCIAIEHWERPGHQPRTRTVSTLAVLIGLAALALLLETVPRRPAESPLPASMLLSALLFCALDAYARDGQHRSAPPRPRLSPLTLRIAADAVLLTPLLFMLLGRA